MFQQERPKVTSWEGLLQLRTSPLLEGTSAALWCAMGRNQSLSALASVL